MDERLELLERGRQVVGVVLLEPPRRLGRGRGAAARLGPLRRGRRARRDDGVGRVLVVAPDHGRLDGQRRIVALCAVRSTMRAAGLLDPALPHCARSKRMRYWCVAMCMESWAARIVYARTA